MYGFKNYVKIYIFLKKGVLANLLQVWVQYCTTAYIKQAILEVYSHLLVLWV